MTTRSLLTPWTFTDDTTFRNLYKSISDEIKAVGLTQVNPTLAPGQINFATVARPAAINTSAGYELFQLGNFFFRIEYWTGAAVTTPLLKVRFGRYQDQGVPVGSNANAAVIDLNNGTGFSAVPMFQHYFSSDASSYFVMCLCANHPIANNLSSLLCLEKSRDSNGTPNNKYLNVTLIGNTGTVRTLATAYNLIIFDAMVAPTTKNFGIYGAVTATNTTTYLPTGLVDSTLPLLPNLFTMGNGGLYQPAGISTRHFYGDDIPPFATFTTTIGAQSRTYLSLSNNSTQGMKIANGTATAGLGTAIIYE
jgi:hypothetical protein